MPDTGCVYGDMHCDIFESFPEILQILWKEDSVSEPELRLKNTYCVVPYAGGSNSELNLASIELQEAWLDIVDVLKSDYLRGWGECDDVFCMNKDFVQFSVRSPPPLDSIDLEEPRG